MNTPYPIDVFISYSHIDNDPPPPIVGWVTTFHEFLSYKLGTRIAKRPEIWRDSKKITGNAYFSATVINRIKETAVMVCIVTPRSVDSEWCEKERQNFIDWFGQNGNLFVDNYCRMLKVVKTPVKEEKMPAALQNTLGYNFFEMDPESGQLKEFDPALGKTYLEKFIDRVYDVAEDIARMLERLADNAPQPGQPHSPPNSSPAIYLAETGAEAAQYRAHLARELQARGFRIVPAKQLNGSRKEREEQITEALREAVGAVHILGSRHPHHPWDTPTSVEEIQFELCNAHFTENPGKQIVWIPPALQSLNRKEGEPELLKHVRDGQHGSGTLEIFECEYNDLLHSLIEELYANSKPKIVKKEPLPTQDGHSKLIYVMLVKQDLEDAAPVFDCLTAQGFEVIRPAFVGEEPQLRQDHEANLRDCDGVLIYFRSGNDLWLNAIIRDMRKAAGRGRERPFEGGAIVVAPPAKPNQITYRSSNLPILEQNQGPCDEILQPFFDFFHPKVLAK